MNNVKILIDSSGSMGEIGVSSVVKYVINILSNNLLNNRIEYQLLSINNEVREYKKIEFNGKLDGNVLKNYLNKNKNETIIFLSDGDFYIKEIDEILENPNLYCIRISESVKVDLEKLTTRDKIFHSSQVSSLLKEII